jgi:hypothetical protein
VAELGDCCACGLSDRNLGGLRPYPSNTLSSAREVAGRFLSNASKRVASRFKHWIGFVPCYRGSLATEAVFIAQIPQSGDEDRLDVVNDASGNVFTWSALAV